MDILACERALLQRQVGGEFLTMDALAEAVGVSRSTVSRFLSGRSLSLKVTLAILGRLRLRFEDVFRPYRPDAASQ
jgi:transcriptional regulator with XRE-family HTH domain